MSALRSPLVHLDASPRSIKRLVLAHDLAARHDATLTALYASAPTALSLPFAMAQDAGDMLAALQQLDIDYRDNAKTLFERSEATATRPVAWSELRGGALIPEFAGRALYHDLLVLGQYDHADPLTVGVASDFIPSVLLASGRPALVVPYVDTATTLGEQPLIAWKATRESAHALTAALPLLQRAQLIHLTLPDEDGRAAEQAQALEVYLRLHGVQAPVRRHASLAADTPGDALLSLAADLGADLLVMGCYGHSRARELVLGGASRTVLKTMTLPVLMAH